MWGVRCEVIIYFAYDSKTSNVLLRACMHAKSLQSCLTLCDHLDCSLPGSPVRGSLQARILEWVAIPFSRGSSWPRDRTQVSCIASRRFNLWATREAHIKYEWHVNGRDEIKEHLSLGEKLGNIVVVSLEGKLIKWQLNTILSVKQLPLLQLSQLEEC